MAAGPLIQAGLDLAFGGHGRGSFICVPENTTRLPLVRSAGGAYYLDTVPFHHGFRLCGGPFGAQAGASVVHLVAETVAAVPHAAAQCATLGAFVLFPPAPSLPSGPAAFPRFMTRAQRIAAHLRMYEEAALHRLAARTLPRAKGATTGGTTTMSEHSDDGGVGVLSDGTPIRRWGYCTGRR